MLVEFKVANFRSFQSVQTVSLVASRDEAHSHNLIGCDKFSLVKAAAIYGPNASGKSTLIKAISAMQKFVLTSATKMNIGDRIKAATPFRLDNDSISKPSRFELTVIINGSTYVYGFSATSERVCEETLDVRKAGGRFTSWFKRQLDSSTQETFWKINGPLKGDADLLQSKTRDNALLLSRGAEFNIKPLIPLFLWFRNRCRILDLSAMPSHLAQSTARMINKDPKIQSRVLQTVRDADLGICGISVNEYPVLNDVLGGAPSVELQNAVRNYEAVLKQRGHPNPTKFRVEMSHEILETGESRLFDLFEDESNGTQRFFSLVGLLLQALDPGNLLVIDELDCSMHPSLTRKLVQFFQRSEANSHGAQLVFTTHDSSLMDSSLLRRDQIWLTEKRRNGATNLFSLYDFDVQSRPRKSEALEKNYLAGRYGGIPKFGPTFEDLEVP